MLANQPIPTVAYSSTTPMRYPSTTRPASELSNDKPPAPDQTKFYPTSFTASSSIPEKQDHTNTGCFSTLDVLFSPLFYFFSRSTPRIDPVPETTGIISTPHPVVQKPTPQDLFPELTPGNLESLISRWTTTHPGLPPAAPNASTS